MNGMDGNAYGGRPVGAPGSEIGVASNFAEVVLLRYPVSESQSTPARVGPPSETADDSSRIMPGQRLPVRSPASQLQQPNSARYLADRIVV